MRRQIVMMPLPANGQFGIGLADLLGNATIALLNGPRRGSSVGSANGPSQGSNRRLRPRRPFIFAVVASSSSPLDHAAFPAAIGITVPFRRYTVHRRPLSA
jgi:hypothetical protein